MFNLKIISGAQTGVDRAALDAAMEASLPHGGFIPKGRLAEDGRISPNYRLTETAESDYALRTELNVMAGKATLIIHHGSMSGGTKYTAWLVRKHKKPACLINLEKTGFQEAVREIIAFLTRIKPAVLNVAGPRESTCPGIYEQTKAILLQVFAKDD
ncbi:MAG: putative molybdenum carrier protein [Elusimicrobia bacterium]|nr:putative molybdenum carrier protein [Elusimicrobiota bacterium]